MDAQLRQRLIGAAVLIALAVIFLPMLLSGRQESGSQEVSLDIPPAGTPATTGEERTVTLPADRTPAPVPVQIPATEEPIASVDTATAPPAETAPAAPTPIQRDPEPPAVMPAPATASAPKPTPPAVVATSARATSNTGGPFHLRLGSYSQADRAKSLVEQLARLGIAADAQPFQSNGKSLYRVQSAGFPSRTAAETARLKAIGAISGLSVTIGESALPTATASSRTPAAGNIAWAVQLGVFGVEAKATELMDKAKRAGLPAYIERVTTANGPAMRVRVGPAPQEAQAKALRDQVKSKLGLEGIVVPHP